MLISNLLIIDFAPLAGILFLLLFLRFNSSLEKEVKKIFYLLVNLELLELLLYSAELYTASFSEPTVVRTLLSAMGYTVRPVLIYLILQLTLQNEHKTWKHKLLILPLVFNIIVAFSALFTDIAYTYDADNVFVRGPLGFTTHVVLLFYLITVLVIIIRTYSGRKKLETIVVFWMVILISGSMILEALYDVRDVGRTAIVLSMIFYYMYFQTLHHIERMDEEKRIRGVWENIARTDRLTGLLNKKVFMEELEQRAENGWNSETALVFFDLDLFKEVNDKLGHLTGDQALIEFASKLEKVFVNTNYICRFGGDEFCVFLENVSEAHLQDLLNTALTVLHTQYKNETAQVTVTASIGVGYLPDGGMMGINELLELADAAVYKAKENGRNQYVVNIRNCCDNNE